MRQSGPRPIMVVEDSDDDFEAIDRALRATTDLPMPPIIRYATGEGALNALRVELQAAADRPGLILLDLNLPGLAGQEVLGAMKASPQLRSIPVIVFTTSDHPGDIRTCYDLGANAYVQKPMDYSGLKEVAARIMEFWIYVNRAPDT